MAKGPAVGKAKSKQQVCVTKETLHSLTQRENDLVTVQVAVTVVDAFEMINIDNG